jgi:hypothetical protein
MPLFESIEVYELDYKLNNKPAWLVIKPDEPFHNDKPLPTKGFVKINYQNGIFEWSAAFTVESVKMKELNNGEEKPFDELYDKESFVALPARGQLTIRRPHTNEPLFRFILKKRDSPDIQYQNESSREFYIYFIETLKPAKTV